MGKSLTEIAQDLKDSPKKVQLIYAFNGTGKTRLSREFKKELAKEIETTDDDDVEVSELSRKNILYYNAFTEDLFYWDNDLIGDEDRKLKIHPNAFTKWVLEDQGQDQNIVEHFQRLTNSTVAPVFNAEYTTRDKNDQEVVVKAFSEICFSQGSGDPADANIKISKGEESNLIWSVFYSLLEQVIEERNILDTDDRSTDAFDNLKYVFIDDPVSSLDDNHLIQLAVELAGLIKSSDYTGGKGLRFIVTTHNPLFFNVLYNEFNRAPKHMLRKLEDGSHELIKQDSDSPFSYHLHLKSELMKAAETGQINKYHFNFLRNVLEKTSTFLGYKEWGELLPGENSDRTTGKVNPYARIINLYNHAKHSGDEISEVEEDHKRVFKFLVEEIDNIYKGTRAQ